MKNKTAIRSKRRCVRSVAMSLLMCSMALQVQAANAAAETWLQCGQMIDVAVGAMRPAVTVVVQGNQVDRLIDGHPTAPNQAQVIDLSQQVCLPGLMDMHTHLTTQSSPQSYIQRFTLNEADVALRGAHFAEITLMAGFTTVRDLGDSFNASLALRDAIAAGHVRGPRVFTAAKSLASTGGHADPTNSWRRDIMGRPGPDEGVVNGTAAAREAVRQRYKDGADLIKITATGGVLSVARSGQNPQFADDELAEIVRIAADYDMHVAAHAHGDEGMQRAIRAGVHSIEHGTYMSRETIELMRAHGTWYVPTISAGRFVAEMAAIPGYFPPVVAAKAAEIGPLIQETFGRAYAAGVKIAFGTDCGVCQHGDNAREFEFMVEAGMPEMEAIRAATVHAASLLGRSDELGQIGPGYLADIIAVSDNPLTRISTLSEVVFVMKDGEVFKGL